MPRPESGTGTMPEPEGQPGAIRGPEGGPSAGRAGDAATGVDGAWSERSHNPFAAVRTRSVIPWMIFVTIALYAALHILALLTPLSLGDESQGEVAAMVAGYGALAGWLFWICRRSGVDIRRLVGRVPADYDWIRRMLLLLVLLAATMAFSLGSFYVFASGLAAISPGTLEFLLETLETPSDPSMLYLLLMPVIVVVVAPVLEETAFRGVLLNRWGHKWGMARAVIATSVVFGFLHANPVGITAVGIVTALLYLQTRTLIVPMIFHGANNLVATLAGFVYETDGSLDVAAEIRESGLWGGLAVLATLPVLIWYIRRHWPGRDAGLPYGSAG